MAKTIGTITPTATIPNNNGLPVIRLKIAVNIADTDVIMLVKKVPKSATSRT